MATHATNRSIQSVLDTYLRKGLGMADTHCSYTPKAPPGPSTAPRLEPEPNPDIAVCLNTTGRDYGAFLGGVLSYSSLPRAIIDESERDYTPGDMAQFDNYTLYGHYGFGHFLECFDSYEGYSSACRAARVHADPGAFGFYPWIDRRYGYWAQIVAFEHGASYPRSGIPEYLRVLIKPYVDVIVQGKDLYTHREQLKSLSMDALNYVNDRVTHDAQLALHAFSAQCTTEASSASCVDRVCY